MWIRRLLAGLGLALAGLVGTAVFSWRRRTRETDRLVADLIAASVPERGRAVRGDDLAALPPPIRRYAETVLREGQPRIERVRIEQSGTFRSGGAAAPWRPFRATQHVTTRPPGFVWDAAIEMMPGVPVRVLDAYHDGRGVLRAALGGVLSVMEATPGPALDEGELLRYLAEAPLYPTALLPDAGVEWAPIDDTAARATLTHGDTTATLTFHVNAQNEVVRVEGERGYTHADGTVEPRPWVGYWRRYRERGGMRVPTEGEVAWRDPVDGAVSYWRGRMDRLTYRPGIEAAPTHREGASNPDAPRSSADHP
jgi:hypothetical protein